MIELENVFKPKKRVFVSLTLASAVIGAMVIYMAWRVALPGVRRHRYRYCFSIAGRCCRYRTGYLRCAHHEDLLLLGLEGCEYLIPLRRCFRQNF